MDALPEIVDGARKISQGGSSLICVCAVGRSRRFSSLPMLEATISRNQCMSAVTSAVHHSGRGSSAVGAAQQISGFNLIRPGGISDQVRLGLGQYFAWHLDSSMAKAYRILGTRNYRYCTRARRGMQNIFLDISWAMQETVGQYRYRYSCTTLYKVN